MSNSPAGRIVVLTAPSGGGKTSIARRLMEVVPSLRFSVSATTRPPRSHEIDGVDYHFLSDKAFRRAIRSGDFVEYEEVYPGRFYGTLKSTVDAATAESPVLLDIDVRGAQSVKKLFGDAALAIFLMPPDIPTLAERLRRRGTDSEADVAVRLERAAAEMLEADSFDQVVVNDNLERAAGETIRRVRSFLAIERT
jgi:guanylate kinase